MGKRYSIFKGNDIVEISKSDIDAIVGISGDSGSETPGGGSGGGSGDSGSGDLSDYEGDVTNEDIENIFNTV